MKKTKKQTRLQWTFILMAGDWKLTTTTKNHSVSHSRYRAIYRRCKEDMVESDSGNGKQFWLVIENIILGAATWIDLMMKRKHPWNQ